MLDNIFRRIEAGELDLIDAPAPIEDIGGRLEPRFGCRPYSAAMEYGPKWGEDGKFVDTGPPTRAVEVELPSGETVAGDVCWLCGSGAKRDGRDFLDSADAYCEICKRSHRDGEIAALRAREG